jgi:hypothetical protein
VLKIQAEIFLSFFFFFFFFFLKDKDMGVGSRSLHRLGHRFLALGLNPNRLGGLKLAAALLAVY